MSAKKQFANLLWVPQQIKERDGEYTHLEFVIVPDVPLIRNSWSNKQDTIVTWSWQTESRAGHWYGGHLADIAHWLNSFEQWDLTRKVIDAIQKEIKKLSEYANNFDISIEAAAKILNDLGLRQGIYDPRCYQFVACEDVMDREMHRYEAIDTRAHDFAYTFATHEAEAQSLITRQIENDEDGYTRRCETYKTWLSSGRPVKEVKQERPEMKGWEALIHCDRWPAKEAEQEAQAA